MKRLISLICAIVFICACVISASANNGAQLKLDVDNVEKDRLFYVNICADNDIDISGGEITVTYDNKIVAFRDLSSEVYSVDVKEYENKLHIIFASNDKASLNKGDVLMSLKFKCIGVGECELGFSCKECINYELEKLSVITQPVTLKVSENDVVKVKSSTENEKQGSTVSKSTTTSSSKISQDDDGSQYDDEKSQRTYSDENTKSFLHSGGTNTKAILYGVSAALAVMILVYLGYTLGKKSKVNK